jgi:hypothetical protein
MADVIRVPLFSPYLFYRHYEYYEFEKARVHRSLLQASGASSDTCIVKI